MSTIRTNEVRMLDDLGKSNFTFDSVQDMKASTQLKVGQKVRTLGYYEPGDGGGNDYEIVAAGTGTDDGGSFINLSGSGLQAKGLFENGYIHVKQFGAPGDDSDSTSEFSNCAAYTASLAIDGGLNKGPQIHVSGGLFKIFSQIPDKANWVIHPDGIINGLPKVSPTSEDDTSYLTGRVFSYSGVDQSRVIRVGDASFTAQEIIKKGHAGEISAYSPNSSPAVVGVSYTSGSPSDGGQGTVGLLGVGVSDGTNKTAWGSYLEAFKGPGTPGNTFGQEITTFNYGTYRQSNPYEAWGKADDLTVPLILNTGDTSPQGTVWGTQSNNSTAALAIYGKGGAKFGTGIIVKKDSVESGHAVALPLEYDIAWINAGFRATAHVAKDSQRLESETYTLETKARWRTGFIGVQQDAALISSTVYTTRDAGDADYALGRWDFYQHTDFSNNEAGSRGELILRRPDGTPLKYRFLPHDLTADDNQASCGSPARRWSQVFAVNGAINTSDEREKEQQRQASEAEQRVAQSLKSCGQFFKWISAVDKKGEDARWHYGWMAQDVKAAFEAEGLDAHAYGMLCYDEWEEQPEIRNEDTGEVTQEYRAAGNRYGVRMDQLLAFIVCNT